MLTLRQISFLVISAVLAIFVFSVLWEFIIEEALTGSYHFFDAIEDPAEKWEYVLTVTTFSIMGMIIPTHFLFKIRKANTSVYQKMVEAKEISEQNGQRFRDFAVASSDWFWEMDSDLRFTYRSQRFFDITGINPEAGYNQDVKIIIDPELEDLEDEKWQLHFQQLNNREPFKNLEYKTRNKNGNIIHISASGYPIFNPEGEFSGYRGAGADITERKRIEEALHETKAQLDIAIDSFSDGFVLYGADDRLVFANGAYLDCHPALRNIQVPGMKFEEIVRKIAALGFYGNTSDEIESYVRKRLEYFRSGKPFEYQMENGCWYEMTEYGTRDGGIALVRSDITGRKRAEKRSLVAKEEAEAANKAKSEFLASMSHDLRTPLNAIMGFSEMMTERVFGPLGDPHYEDYANDIRNSGCLLKNLIDDVLDLSKVEAGKFELVEEKLDISLPIGSSIKMLNKQVKDKKINLVNTCELDLPKLLGDERAVTQIVNNLLSNAIKFTPNEGVITIKAGIAKDKRLHIQISDSGIGMSEEDIIKVLNPFEQADSQHARKHEGTGLGLHLSHQFMKLHDGELTIESEIDKGTTVTVSFPPERVIVDE